MSAPIEDYAIIGDTQTVALVCRDGSIDWLCLPRFDSGACFAALLGNDENGHWTIAPAAGGLATRRCYRDRTLVLESEWDTADGTVRVIDFMPPRETTPDVVRIVEGVSGRVAMRMTLRLRFEYGSVVPWVRRIDGQPAAIAGPDAAYLRSDVETRGEDFATRADFSVAAGERVRFVLTWHPSHLAPPAPVDPERALVDTARYWREWSKHCNTGGPYGDTIVRSAVTLKALTYSPTGGIVAAATTSLPENLGGVRNWDYRFCWLRDATLTLQALLTSGYTEEAKAWRQWLLRAIAGSPADLQIMYGVAGERRLAEWTVDWLPGYEGSSPVRIGNAAARQLQLDVYGEVLDALSLARDQGVGYAAYAWSLQRTMVEHLSERWREPDEGLWEVRGPRQNFTHSKVMCWVAFDRAARAVEKGGLPGPAQRWRATAAEIHRTVCEQAYDEDRNTFVQAFGSTDLDASLLLIPRLGFLPGSDPRVAGTVDAINRELCVDGFVQRYSLHPTAASANVDGLPGTEGAFLACSFWLADAMHMVGRRDEAKQIFDRLLGLRNDVGLLAEEYDPALGRQVGNFPQAFSHVGLINTAALLGGDAVESAGTARPAAAAG